MARKRSTETPPYVPKKGLTEVLEAVQAHKKGDVITKEELHKRGVSSHLIYPAMGALRFLGLIDENGTLLGGHEAFGRENSDKDLQKQIIMNSYKDFFEEAKIPFTSEEEIKEKFQEVYNLSEKLTGSCYPLFKHLAEEAGIDLIIKADFSKNEKEEETGSIPEVEIKEEKLSSETAGEDKQAFEEEVVGKHRHLGVQVVVTIQVNKYTTEKDIIKMVKTAKKAIHLIRKSGDSHY
ncbi:MAG: DUF5343 domain-containing protein [Acidobacteria bacterium]|nr:DUF5343 domain-containing protein [Acidobacteriota bacterium]